MSAWTIWWRAIVGAAAVWFALAMVFATDPLGDFALFVVLFFLGLATAAAWLVYSVAWRGVFVSRGRVIWIAIPLVPVVAIVIGAAQLPLIARVRLAEKPLLTFIESGQESGRAGTFTITNQSRRGNCAFLTTSHGFMFDVGGLAYLPAAALVPDDVLSGRISLTHLYGPWYRFVISD